MDHYNQLCRCCPLSSTIAWCRRLSEEIPTTADAMFIHKTQSGTAWAQLLNYYDCETCGERVVHIVSK